MASKGKKRNHVDDLSYSPSNEESACENLEIAEEDVLQDDSPTVPKRTPKATFKKLKHVNPPYEFGKEDITTLVT